ncbi:hypothetical protein E5D57_004623 [Metarhizium anisopliae]|nr:hypothetical protein E5D57_004623 [Metarhizium anisopliae]
MTDRWLEKPLGAVRDPGCDGSRITIEDFLASDAFSRQTCYPGHGEVPAFTPSMSPQETS